MTKTINNTNHDERNIFEIENRCHHLASVGQEWLGLTIPTPMWLASTWYTEIHKKDSCRGTRSLLRPSFRAGQHWNSHVWWLRWIAPHQLGVLCSNHDNPHPHRSTGAETNRSPMVEHYPVDDCRCHWHQLHLHSHRLGRMRRWDDWLHAALLHQYL